MLCLILLLNLVKLRHLSYVQLIFWLFLLQFQQRQRVLKRAHQMLKQQLKIIYKNKYWDLPKGKVNYKESIESAAIREVQEETNVQNLKIPLKVKS